MVCPWVSRGLFARLRAGVEEASNVRFDFYRDSYRIRWHEPVRADTGNPRNPYLAHILIRADTAPGGLTVLGSEDQLHDHAGSARILACGAWEGSWEESLSQPSKYTLTWVLSTDSGPLASAAQRERWRAPLPEVVRLTLDLYVGSPWPRVAERSWCASSGAGRRVLVAG